MVNFTIQADRFFTAVGQVDPGRHSGIQRLRKDRYSLTGGFNGTNRDTEIRKTRSVKRAQSDWGRWRTPSLRNLVHTALYMHDCSLKDLPAVIDAYPNIDLARLHTEGESILKPLALSAQ